MAGYGRPYGLPSDQPSYPPNQARRPNPGPARPQTGYDIFVRAIRTRLVPVGYRSHDDAIDQFDETYAQMLNRFIAQMRSADKEEVYDALDNEIAETMFPEVRDDIRRLQDRRAEAYRPQALQYNSTPQPSYGGYASPAQPFRPQQQDSSYSQNPYAPATQPSSMYGASRGNSGYSQAPPRQQSMTYSPQPSTSRYGPTQPTSFYPGQSSSSFGGPPPSVNDYSRPESTISSDWAQEPTPRFAPVFGYSPAAALTPMQASSGPRQMSGLFSHGTDATRDGGWAGNYSATPQSAETQAALERAAKAEKALAEANALKAAEDAVKKADEEKAAKRKADQEKKVADQKAAEKKKSEEEKKKKDEEEMKKKEAEEATRRRNAAEAREANLRNAGYPGMPDNRRRPAEADGRRGGVSSMHDPNHRPTQQQVRAHYAAKAASGPAPAGGKINIAPQPLMRGDKVLALPPRSQGRQPRVAPETWTTCETLDGPLMLKKLLIGDGGDLATQAEKFFGFWISGDFTDPDEKGVAQHYSVWIKPMCKYTKAADQAMVTKWMILKEYVQFVNYHASVVKNDREMQNIMQWLHNRSITLSQREAQRNDTAGYDPLTNSFGSLTMNAGEKEDAPVGAPTSPVDGSDHGLGDAAIQDDNSDEAIAKRHFDASYAPVEVKEVDETQRRKKEEKKAKTKEETKERRLKEKEDEEAKLAKMELLKKLHEKTDSTKVESSASSTSEAKQTEPVAEATGEVAATKTEEDEKSAVADDSSKVEKESGEGQ